MTDQEFERHRALYEYWKRWAVDEGLLPASVKPLAHPHQEIAHVRFQKSESRTSGT